MILTVIKRKFYSITVCNKVILKKETVRRSNKVILKEKQPKIES